MYFFEKLISNFQEEFISKDIHTQPYTSTKKMTKIIIRFTTFYSPVRTPSRSIISFGPIDFFFNLIIG